MAVEAALITPLFVLLVFGIIEFGMLFKDWLAVSSSVRAGTRIASALPRDADFATEAVAQVALEGGALNMADVEELWVYKADADGKPVGNGSFSDCTTCVKFTWDSSSSGFLPQSSLTWTNLQQNACQGDANRDIIGVYLQIKHKSITGLIFDDMKLAEHTVMKLEPMSITGQCKP